MNLRHLVPLMLVIIAAIPATGWGQELFQPSKVRYESSPLFPVVPLSDFPSGQNDRIPTELILKINGRCMSRMPERFPPRAHTDYCACAAAATQGTMTMGDLKALQKEENRVLGNPSFEKYVTSVMKPCMEEPIADIEYMSCITSQGNDWQIRYPIPFCKCVSRGVQEHFKSLGTEELMVSWGNLNRRPSDDPAKTLWSNQSFLKAREHVKDQCVGDYMDPQYFKKKGD